MPNKNINPQNIIQLGVGAVVFKDDAILLVKRRNPPYRDQWAIPGGKVRFCEPLKEAVAREILEETGIGIDVQEPIYTFEVISDRAENGSQDKLHYIVIDYFAVYRCGDIQAGDDASSAAWISRTTFNDLDVNQETRTLLHDKFSFP